MARIRPAAQDNRDISGTGVWTPFRKASEWAREDIPCQPGLYNIIALDISGEPTKWSKPIGADFVTIEQARRVLAQEFPGVLYVGKACNLHDRFWTLIRSWRDLNTKPSDCHGSRETWESDANLMAEYPFDAMRFRCMPVSGTDWEEMKKAKKGGGLKALLAGIPDGNSPLGHNREFEPVEHVSIKEYQAIARFHRYAGKLPPLNLIAGEHPGGFPDQAWWLQYHGEQSRLKAELEGLFGADDSEGRTKEADATSAG